ncbi:MAG TPA: HAMP domain-containing sensor histidine kinase [Pseudonocardiaceae bacterium]|nr:HAMP domain-containing sensor histidine kinase [Pseudonocardiaceae bacterium]
MSRAVLGATLLAAGAAVVVLLALFGVLEWRELATTASADAAAEARAVAGAVVDPESGVVDVNVIRTAIGATEDGAAGDVAVHLSDGRTIGDVHAPAAAVAAAARSRLAGTFGAPGGQVLLVPVAANGAPTAVVEVYLGRWAVLGPWLRSMTIAVAGGVVALALAALVGWRRTRPLVKSVRAVVAAAATIGAGRTGVPVPPSKAAEITQLIATLNQISRHVEDLIASERDFVADLSHRLRTPLTALRLDSESIGEGPVAHRIRHAVAALETDVDDLIQTAAKATRVTAASCDVAKVVRDRMAFWSTFAEHQGRRCELSCDTDAAPAGLSDTDMGAVVDALLGNVFQHTAVGIPFAATVVRYAGWVTLVVEDGGPGIVDSEAALRRGASSRGSTGLGLDIARHAVEATGGTIHVDRGRLGGARIRLRFAEAGSQHDNPAPRAWRLWSHSADLPASG